MPNVEKVISTLEEIKTQTAGIGLDSAVIAHKFIDIIIAMLKEQEAEWIYGEDETGVDGWHCSECSFFEPWFYEFDDDIDFIKRYEHCPKCGRRMTSYTGKQEGW